jgi:hypothetical protein
VKNVIITGASGMVGKAVLLECIEDGRVGEILLVNRKSINFDHPKVTELLVPDFTAFSDTKLPATNYDACLFCMGVSVAGLSEKQYTEITYDIAKIFVDALYQVNPKMVFNYISGEGTDSSEKGKNMWARVKGKTENMIFDKGFGDAYAFRAGMIIPEKGIVSKTKLYRITYILTSPFFFLFRKMKNVTTTTKFGKAMINTLFFPQENKYLGNQDINLLANK